MLDIDREEELVQKVGGKFALTTLLQKRMVELNRGSAPLVEVDGNRRDLRRIVCKEILEGKIELTSQDALAYVEEEKRLEAVAPVAGAAPSGGEEEKPAEDGHEIYGSDIKKIKEQRIKELAQLLNPKK